MKRISGLFLFALALSYAASAQTVNFSEHVAPILYSHCTTCHHQGSLAPFPLETYSDAFLNRTAIASYTSQRIMPPWPPDDKYSSFIHDRSLSDSQIQVIQKWVTGGAVQGDPKLAPPVPVFSNDPVLGHPDFTMTIPQYTVTSTTDDYRCFAMSADLTSDQFITGIEPLPGNHKIVHHILIYYDTTGACQKADDADPLPGYAGFGGVGSSSAKLLGAWVPGAGPVQFPKGMGTRVYKGGTYVLQIHYAPGSNGESDNTSINFIYSNQPGLREVSLAPILNHATTLTNGPLVIPAGQTKWFHEKYKVPAGIDFSLLTVAPHMHLLGQVMNVYAVDASGDTTHLISIKSWDFHWQGQYTFPHPVKIKGGTTLYADAYYDNTDLNAHNPNNPPKVVTVGESTTNEMMLCFLGFLPYKAGDENFDLDALEQLPTTVGVSAGQDIHVTLFPNPAGDNFKINFSLPSFSETKIDVFDLQGRMIKNLYSGALDAGPHEIDIQTAGLQPGTFFVRVQHAAGEACVKLDVIR